MANDEELRMSRDGFEAALAEAQSGQISTCNGAEQDLLDVLETIASHGSTAELVAEAEAAFASQNDPERISA